MRTVPNFEIYRSGKPVPGYRLRESHSIKENDSSILLGYFNREKSPHWIEDLRFTVVRKFPYHNHHTRVGAIAAARHCLQNLTRGGAR